MDAGTASRIEKFVDRGASALLAAAVGYSAYRILSVRIEKPALIVAALAAFALAYLVCRRLLACVGMEKPRFQVPIFDVRGLEPEACVESSEGDIDQAPDMLELDDVLPEIEPDSRVVHLFDPAAMPTPSDLKDRIDRHLDREARHGPPPDAAQALYEALAELRRSLR
jgi:hypothetical protein